MNAVWADCHAHVFDPGRYPYAVAAHYTPLPSEAGTPEQFLSVLDTHGFSHGLIVGAAPYGTDNSCLVDAIRRAGGRLKGIACVKNDVSEAEVSRLSHQGVVGIRLNLFHEGLAPLLDPSAKNLLNLIREAGWLCQIQYRDDQLIQAMPILLESRVHLVIDHCGRPDPARGVRDGGFQALLELGRRGHAAKLSGAARFSKEPYPHKDADPFVAAIIGAFTPANCVWGSDWPFSNMNMRLDYGPVLALLSRWIPDASDRQAVLSDTPARLFGFAVG